MTSTGKERLARDIFESLSGKIEEMVKKDIARALDKRFPTESYVMDRFGSNYEERRTGQLWSRYEDECLRKELKKAIEQIAIAHRRGFNGITTRIHSKKILDSIFYQGEG